jgi:predicted small secreted protein
MSKSLRSVFKIAPVLLLILLLTLCAAAVTACVIDVGGTGEDVRGSGNVTSEDRPVSGVNGVALRTLGDLTIEVGGQESLRIEAEDNLLQYLETTVSGGVLNIQQAEDIDLRPREAIHYYLTVKSLESIEVASSGNVAAPALTAGGLTVDVTSSGDVELASLEADSLTVRLSSSGGVTIGGGQVTSQEARLSSSGDYKAGDLRSSSATVGLSSSGSAIIWVTDRLTADLSSSGDLEYYGSPQADVNESSSGDARSLGEK